MKIKVLGSGCPSCKALYETVLGVTKNDKEISVEYITDITALIEAGIMAGPALLIDEKIVSVGRVPSSEEVKEYIDNCKDMNSESPSSGCSCGGNC
ncbi:MAG: Redox-active disulfide protein 2 [Parcubacteria bacterium 33_209]|nr:MAG: Redox-active disulfide protein 2 [Parcubacteria bacterium 33_209]